MMSLGTQQAPPADGESWQGWHSADTQCWNSADTVLTRSADLNRPVLTKGSDSNLADIKTDFIKVMKFDL